MKKMLVTLGIILAVSSLQSCRKGCYICSKGLDQFDVCEENFSDYEKQQKAFNSAINLAEADGYKCKKD